MLFQALLFSLLPVASAGFSGGVAALRTPGERVTSGLQHVAAGVVFAAASIELLPGVIGQSPTVAILGFAAGIVVMFTFRAASERAEHRQEVAGRPGLPVGLLTAAGVDFFIDGVILGAGFASARSVGVLLVVAVAVEYLFVGLSLAAPLAAAGSRLVVGTVPALLALLTVVGAGVGVLALHGASPALLAGVLAFGAVAFMYLATEELLVEAHVRGESAPGSVGFFLGFLLYLVLHQLIE